MDLLIESSFSIESSLSPPKTNRNKEINQSEEASYLVIGGGEVQKEEHYANFQSEVNKSKIVSTGTENNGFVSPSKNNQMRTDKPQTSSSSTTFTVAPSISSTSSSSAPSSMAPLSPISMDCDLKSPSSVHDSTISRLIDAVSLGNEQDTCGSISALIGQFESTVDQNNFSTLSHGNTPSRQSNFRPTTPKALEGLSSPLKTGSPNKKNLISPQKVAQKTNVYREILSPHKISQVDLPAPPLISSPETAELEEVYTILDEEVLLPVSVYNLNKQTVHVQADTIGSTPSSSLGSSPTKVAQGLGKGRNMGWDDVNRKRGEIEEIEERVYEEVSDLPPQVADIERSTSKRYMNSSANSECFRFLNDSAGGVVTEVELNVDEDPLEMMLTSPRNGSQWEGLISPTKRHAIYENHESTHRYSHQKQQYPSHSSHVAFPQCHSPLNQPSYQLSNHHQHQDNSKHPLHHRLANSRPSNHSPLRQNSFPIPQSNSEAFSNSRDLSRSYAQQRSYSGTQIQSRSHQDRIGYKQMEREQVDCFHNGFSSFESLPSQSAVSTNMCRDRGLYSPSSDCETVYSHLDFDCIMPSSESSAPQNTQNQTQSHGVKQSWNQKVSLTNTRQQPQTESRGSLYSNSGPLSAPSQSATIDSTAPSPCKSKSLGDLTSEDISCNFQSKYNIISRSFITPHMRRQKKVGTMGGVTFQSQSCDPLTEQLRKLVSLEGDDSDRDRSQSPHLHQEAKSPVSQSQATNITPVLPRDTDDSPPLLTRRLSSRSQSRVRHINSRARERQQEALKSRAGATINSTGGVVLRNKPASQNPLTNRHSTGSYIAGYLGQLEDRGLPEGACTSLRYGNGDHYGDRYYTDDSLPSANTTVSEPEVYFLLRL